MLKEYLSEHLLTYVSLLAIVGCGLAGAHWPGIAAVYPTIVGGVLALCGVHKISENASDYIAKKADSLESAPEETTTK